MNTFTLNALDANTNGRTTAMTIKKKARLKKANEILAINKKAELAKLAKEDRDLKRFVFKLPKNTRDLARSISTQIRRTPTSFETALARVKAHYQSKLTDVLQALQRKALKGDCQAITLYLKLFYPPFQELSSNGSSRNPSESEEQIESSVKQLLAQAARSRVKTASIREAEVEFEEVPAIVHDSQRPKEQ